MKTNESNMSPEKIERLCAWADGVFDEEKRARIGDSETCPSVRKIFFVDQTDNVMALTGMPFSVTHKEVADAWVLVLPLFNIVLNSCAVLTISEMWVADRCHSCGRPGTDDPCPACSKPACWPADNPHRQEMFAAILLVRNGDEAVSWSAEIRRGDDDNISGFNDMWRCHRAPAGEGGRLELPWTIQKWMMPHFLENYPILAQHLGRDADSLFLDIRVKMKASLPPDFPYIRLDEEALQRFVDEDPSSVATGEEDERCRK